MALSIEVPYQPSQVEAFRQRIDVSATVANGADINALVSLNLNHRPDGGDFEIVLENYVNSFSFQENQVISVLQISGRTYTGVITNVIDSVTPSGIFLKISGQLTTAFARSVPALSFSSSAPFVNPATGILPQPLVPLVDNHYRLLDLRASSVLSILSQRSGLPISGSLAFDYPVWGFEASSGSAYNSVAAIAMAGGSHAVVRFGLLSEISLIPYGTNMQSYTWNFWETIDGIEPDYEKTEYTHVEISPSSEITPWNSTYAGYPVQIGTISLEMGGSSSSDVSNRSASQAPDSLVFPQVQGNSWVGVNLPVGDDITENLFTLFGTNNMWKIEKTGIGLATVPVASYRLVSGALGAEPDFDEIPTISYTSAESYEVLYRWSLAAQKFTSQGDIYPYLYVIPSQFASENSPNFNIDSSEVFNCRPYFGVKTPGLPTPTLPGQTFPSIPGYIVPIFQNENCTFLGANVDGSFWVGIEPLPGRVGHGEFGATQPTESLISENKQGPFGSPLSLVIRKDPYTLPVDAKESLSQRIEVQYSDTPKYEKEDVILITSNSPSFDQRKTDLAAVINGYQDFDLVIVPDEAVAAMGKRKKFFIRQMQMVDTDQSLTPNGPSIRIRVDKVPNYDYTGPFYLAKTYFRDMNPALEYVAPLAINLNDSGLVDENPGPLAGEWTLYALPRRVYVPTIVSSVGVGSTEAQLYYDGQRPSNMPVPKQVSSNLVTDFWGHGKNLCKSLADFLGNDFCSFSVSKLYRNDGIPQPGDLLTVVGIPKRGSATSTVVDVGISISKDSGFRVTATCGRLETL